MPNARSVDDLPIHEKIMMSLISKFETGRWKRKYDVAAVTADDAGGLSVGWLQLARRTNTRLLEKACEMYLLNPEADETEKEELLNYMPSIKNHRDPTPEDSMEMRDFFAELADDKAWRDCQDEIAMQEMDKAKAYAKQFGWTTQLGLMACYEAVILGGIETCMTETYKAIKRTKKKKEVDKVIYGHHSGNFRDFYKKDMYLLQLLKDFDVAEKVSDVQEFPIDPSNPDEILRAFLAVRHAWLANFRGPTHPIRKTIYRTNTLRWLYHEGIEEFELDMGIRVYNRVKIITEDILKGEW